MTEFTKAQLYGCCPELSEPEWGQFARLELLGCALMPTAETLPAALEKPMQEFLSNGKYIMSGLDRKKADFFIIYGIPGDRGAAATAINQFKELAQAIFVMTELSRISGLPSHILC